MAKRSHQHLPYLTVFDNPNRECWAEITNNGLLTETQIDEIKDDDESGSLMTAAIPNPLARIYLFKNSFEYFSKQLNNNNYQFNGPNALVVSDCLDFLQFLFENQDNSLIKVKEWNIEQRIAYLKNSPNIKHNHLGDTLEMFLASNFRSNNFSSFNLVYYIHNGIEILIGGTSPFTMVYTSPNWRRELENREILIRSTDQQDVFFDNDYFPLERRSQNFRHWLYTISNSNPNLTISNYLTNIKNRFERDLLLEDIDENLFEDILVDGVRLKTGGLILKKHRQANEYRSDLYITPDDHIRGYNLNNSFNAGLPLVIGEKMDFDGIYLDSYRYDPSKVIPAANADVGVRKIPNTGSGPNSGIKYPFLTTKDFFTDKLVKIPFQINDDHFYTGVCIDDEFSKDYRYLLPLTSIYFQFFSPELINDRLTFDYRGGEVVFTLKIPVSGREPVILTKSYVESDINSVNLGLAIFPLIRFETNAVSNNSPQYNSYNVMALYEDGTSIDLRYHKSNDISSLADSDTDEKLTVLKSTRITNKQTGLTNHYHIKDYFDFIVCKINVKEGGKTYNAEGIILPRFIKRSNGETKFNVAIDFGTSNTFVGICNDGGNEMKPLTFDSPNETLIGLLNKKPTNGNYFGGFGDVTVGFGKALQTEFAPPLIKRRSDDKYISFPVRTVSSESTLESTLKNLFLYSNIAFYYESDDLDTTNPLTKKENLNFTYTTNIKSLYENNPSGENEEKVKNIFRELLWLIKCKVLLNHGSLKESDFKLIWTYPAVGNFERLLTDLFDETAREVFGVKDGRCIINTNKNISESIAPFIYLENHKPNNGQTIIPALKGRCINVDIGGGTTDIVIFDDSVKKYFYSSVKFAGNDLWGSGLNDKLKDNGFTKAWEKMKEEKISRASSVTPEFLYYKVLKNRSSVNASDKTNLLFRYNDKLEFTRIFTNISDNYNYLKYPLLIHFSAILYYVLSLCKKREISTIYSLSFSGKGSSYINILFDGADLKDYIEKFTISFNKINDCNLSFSNSNHLQILENPKEVTAYGALYSLEQNNIEIKKPIPIHFLDFVDDNLNEIEDGGVDAEIENINKLDDTQIETEVLNEVSKFFNVMQRSSELKVCIDKLFDYKEIVVKTKLRESIADGLINSSFIKSNKIYYDNKGTKFFYPFKDSIYSLTELIINTDFNKK